MSDRVRSEKQLLNDMACSKRMKAYHEQNKRAKEQLIIEDDVVLKSSESITPLKNPPDELDIPLRMKRPYVKRKNIGDSVVYSA